MFENIERIKAPPRDVFMREYVLKQRPVIITNLFEGQPIERVRDVELVRRELGDTRVLMQMGHEERNRRAILALMSGQYDSSWDEVQETTINEYLEHLAANPKTTRVVAETPRELTPKINALYEIPDYCRTGTGAVDPDFRGELWLGRAGNASLLHYDRDAKNLMQYQLFGEKRIILVTPRSGKKLAPIRNTCINTQSNVSDEELDRFVRYVDGYQGMVRAGETIFFPALQWHAFYYSAMSMSLTMRFMRPPHMAFLADKFHTDHHLQALAYELMDWDGAEEKYRAAYRELEAAYARPHPNPLEKAEQIQALAEDLYRRVCTKALQGSFSRGFVDILRQAARRVEVEQAGQYRDQAAA